MLTIDRCKKILEAKAIYLTDEQIESLRDELYLVANLAFEHWQKGRCLTEKEKNLSFLVSQEPTSTPLPTGESADVNSR